MKVIDLPRRKIVSTGTKWEPIVGYSRAVLRGNQIAVTGTIGVNDDGTIPDGITAQTRRSIEIVMASIKALGGGVSDVVRTRIYVTNAAEWQEVGKVHAEIFGDVRPATTVVEVSALVVPEALVEIEADAILAD